MKGIALEIGHVARERAILHRVAPHQPTGMRPPPAVARRVRVTGLVGIVVMEAMRRDPKERTALQGESAADGEEVFEPPRRFVTAMGEEPVIAHTDAPAA